MRSGAVEDGSYVGFRKGEGSVDGHEKQGGEIDEEEE
jgi:hypothetical protein